MFFQLQYYTNQNVKIYSLQWSTAVSVLTSFVNYNIMREINVVCIVNS